MNLILRRSCETEYETHQQRLLKIVNYSANASYLQTLHDLLKDKLKFVHVSYCLILFILHTTSNKKIEIRNRINSRITNRNNSRASRAIVSCEGGVLVLVTYLRWCVDGVLAWVT